MAVKSSITLVVGSSTTNVNFQYTAIANPPAQRGNYEQDHQMYTKSNERPLVPGSSTILGHGSGHGNGGTGGAKNPRATDRYHNKLDLATYNRRTLRLDDHLAELEVELGKIRWHLLGLCEVRRQGEDTITLPSGYLFYFHEGDLPSQGGVGFLVNRTLVDNVVEVSSVSSRVAYLVLKLTESYFLKVIQVYAPTSTHHDDEIETLYDDVSRALHNTSKAHYNVVMGDFNAKVDFRDSVVYSEL